MGSDIGARPQANPVPWYGLSWCFLVKSYGESEITLPKVLNVNDYCGHRTDMKPAPEAAQWFQAFFEEDFKNANPPF